ncbi:amidohydrolase [Jeotgalibacillus sp. S-D1]|uniref:amidohydrolase n=1 Tax=Jeotgalibacillus sp. S-D1 TaxID=2552189 RepID=UPI001F0EFDB6|nr:amidohydrolase [Jeotgalibacillus sp. S-D1]
MDLIKTFEALHSIPEVSFQEVKTTDYLETLLKAQNIDVVRFPNHTGLTAQIGSGKPVVGIRADIDALWQEVDGKMQANHSCGHDAHMTIGLGVLSALKKEEASLKGTVRCLFQPAEEQGNGSLSVIKTGAADDLDFLFGVHLRPKEELPLGQSAPSLRHGAAIFFEGKIQGDDFHGARPHQGVNAIDVGMMLQQQLNRLRLSPMLPHSIKMTKFMAGGKSPNIIPGTASFSIDARAQTNGDLKGLQTLAQQCMDSIGSVYGVKIEGSWIDFTPGAEVSSEAEDILAYAIRQTQGTDMLAEPIITPGSDDFHFYTIERPHLKASMLALGADLSPGLHHPKMTFDHSCLQQGVDILTCAVKKVLKP